MSCEGEQILKTQGITAGIASSTHMIAFLLSDYLAHMLYGYHPFLAFIFCWSAALAAGSLAAITLPLIAPTEGEQFHLVTAAALATIVSLLQYTSTRFTVNVVTSFTTESFAEHAFMLLFPLFHAITLSKPSS